MQDINDLAADEESPAAFYDRFAPVARAIATRILGSSGEPEAVVEEILLKFWKRAGRDNKTRRTLEVELVLATRQAAVRRLRELRHLPPHSLNTAGSGLMEECLPSPEEFALVAGRQELLKRLLSQLPPSQIRILELALFEGYSEEEIGHVLGEPLGRVKDEIRASLRFARQRMQTLLGTWIADI
jgi:RNA polymerase sigma-70 factor, ECF subfamily